jgi:hypothetical protein
MKYTYIIHRPLWVASLFVPLAVSIQKATPLKRRSSGHLVVADQASRRSKATNVERSSPSSGPSVSSVISAAIGAARS